MGEDGDTSAFSRTGLIAHLSIAGLLAVAGQLAGDIDKLNPRWGAFSWWLSGFFGCVAVLYSVAVALWARRRMRERTEEQERERRAVEQRHQKEVERLSLMLEDLRSQLESARDKNGQLLREMRRLYKAGAEVRLDFVPRPRFVTPMPVGEGEVEYREGAPRRKRLEDFDAREEVMARSVDGMEGPLTRIRRRFVASRWAKTLAVAMHVAGWAAAALGLSLADVDWPPWYLTMSAALSVCIIAVTYGFVRALDK